MTFVKKFRSNKCPFFFKSNKNGRKKKRTFIWPVQVFSVSPDWTLWVLLLQRCLTLTMLEVVSSKYCSVKSCKMCVVFTRGWNSEDFCRIDKDGWTKGLQWDSWIQFLIFQLILFHNERMNHLLRSGLLKMEQMYGSNISRNGVPVCLFAYFFFDKNEKFTENCDPIESKICTVWRKEISGIVVRKENIPQNPKNFPGGYALSYTFWKNLTVHLVFY